MSTVEPLMTDRTQPTTDQTQSEGDRDLARVLALLESDRIGPITFSTLRDRGVRSPGQAVYDLQLAGYQIDRVSHTDADGRRTLSYCLRGAEPITGNRLAGAKRR